MTGPDGYAARARHYAAEIAAAPEPRLLAELLRPGLRLAELPSGTGHFLHAYTAAGAQVTLIDACPDMLGQALAAISPRRVRTVCRRVEDLTPQDGPFDLAVIPNGALNHLAADAEPADALTAVARLLNPGGLLLAQVVLADESAPARACGFYDPDARDGAWVTDRQFTAADGRQMVRRRRQQHDGNRLHIDFELTADGAPQYASGVDLRLLTTSDLQQAAATAGLTLTRTLAGDGGLHELVAGHATRIRR